MVDEMSNTAVDVFSVIKEKEALIAELNKVNGELLKATINYKTVKANLWLNTDFEEILDKKRPTVDEKKAYVTTHSITHLEQRDKVIHDKEVLLKKIELCDDKLGVL